MTNARRSFPVLLAFLFAFAGTTCGSEPAAPRAIVDLSDAEAQALCQDFFTAACAAGLAATGDPACTSCQPCAQTASQTTIRAQCGDGITDAAVRHCIASGFDMPTCTGPERGGCMFDVGDMLCPLAAGPM